VSRYKNVIGFRRFQVSAAAGQKNGWSDRKRDSKKKAVPFLTLLFPALSFYILFKALFNSLEPLPKLSVESHEFSLYRDVLAIFVTHPHPLIVYPVIPGLVQY